MFKSLFDKTQKTRKTKNNYESEWEHVEFASRNVEQMLTELKEVPSIDGLMEAIDLSATDSRSECSSDGGDTFDENSVDDTDGEIVAVDEQASSVTVVEHGSPVEDPIRKKLVNQIGSLQCLFTWNLNPPRSPDRILKIKNEYGEYNLDISTREFTLER